MYIPKEPRTLEFVGPISRTLFSREFLTCNGQPFHPFYPEHPCRPATGSRDYSHVRLWQVICDENVR